MATIKNSVNSVGNINSSDIRTLPEVFAGEDLQNYSIVTLGYEGDKRVAHYSKGEGKEYLLGAVEVMYDGETYTEFYVGKGEGIRVVDLESGVLRFETSNYDIASPARGQIVAWDGEAKKFVLDSEEAKGTKYKLVNVGGTFQFGVPIVRLEVI